MALERHTGTYDAELLAAIRQEVGPRGVSAFLNEAARQHLARRRMLRLLDDLDAAYGAPSTKEMAEVAADAERIFAVPAVTRSRMRKRA